MKQLPLIEILQKLQPTFIKAGELACKMQKGVHHHNKFNSGNHAADIVTEADLAVQELLLGAISKTDLINCQLLGEEDTPLTKKFNNHGKYYLAIDPIDDTAIYAKGGKYFSQIITLHDGVDVLFLFVRYPALDWTHIVVKNNYSVIGNTPEFSLISEAKQTIIYWVGDPERTFPSELLTKIKNKGFRFAKLKTLSKDIANIPLFVRHEVAGVYQENPNVYDGLTEYTIGLTKSLNIYTDSDDGRMDLTNIKTRETGLYYPGYYLALNVRLE